MGSEALAETDKLNPSASVADALPLSYTETGYTTSQIV